MTRPRTNEMSIRLPVTDTIKRLGTPASYTATLVPVAYPGRERGRHAVTLEASLDVVLSKVVPIDEDFVLIGLCAALAGVRQPHPRAGTAAESKCKPESNHDRRAARAVGGPAFGAVPDCRPRDRTGPGCGW